MFLEFSQLAFVLVLLLGLFALIPGLLYRVKRACKGKGAATQLRCFFLFESVLGLSVFLAFFTAWFTFELIAVILPGGIGLQNMAIFWDSALTARGLVYVWSCLWFPYFLFTRLGLLVIRDVHQLCREQRDLVVKEYSLKWWWTGV